MKLILSILFMSSFLFSCVEQAPIPLEEELGSEGKSESCAPVTNDCTREIANALKASSSSSCDKDGKLIPGQCIASACAEGYTIEQNICVVDQALAEAKKKKESYQQMLIYLD